MALLIMLYKLSSPGLPRLNEASRQLAENLLQDDTLTGGKLYQFFQDKVGEKADANDPQKVLAFLFQCADRLQLEG